MSTYEEVRRALASRLTADVLLNVTRLMGTVRGDDVQNPIILHTILTVLEGTRQRWFESYPTTVELAASLQERIVPAVDAVLNATAGSPAELLAALDQLVRTYRRCVQDFPP
jgi:hypothetical protein